MSTVLNDLTDDSPKIPQPDTLNIELMEHQKTAVRAMLSLESSGTITALKVTDYTCNLFGPHFRESDYILNTSVGILADRVGAGKSLVAVALINSKKVATKRNPYIAGSPLVSVQRVSAGSKVLDTNVVVVPQKLTLQWQKFFELAPKLKVAVYTNIKDVNKYNNPEEIGKYDVVIVSNTKLKEFIINFGSIVWSRIIVDEIDSIPLPTNFRLQAPFTWLITATPGRLRYSKKGIVKDIFKNIKYWVLDYIQVKNREEFLEQSIVLPTPKRTLIKCLTPPELLVVKQFVPTSVLGMINAGNTDDAIKSLNCNVDTNDNILQVITKQIQDGIETREKELKDMEKKKKKLLKSKKKSDEAILLQLDKKSKILTRSVDRLTNRLQSIRQKVSDLDNQTCPVCMDEMEKPALLNCCKNMFCFECIMLTLGKGNTCPSCRHTIYKEDIHIIKDKIDKKEDEDSEPKEHLKSKMDSLMELLDKLKGRKVLIFSDFYETFDKIVKELPKKKLTHAVLQGSSRQVSKAIDQFSKGKINLLMLNATHFGAGLNLQVADDIIIYHRFNLDLEEQVIGRAQRLGRKTPLNVFYLLHDTEETTFHKGFDEVDYQKWLDTDPTKESEVEYHDKVVAKYDLTKEALPKDSKTSKSNIFSKADATKSKKEIYVNSAGSISGDVSTDDELLNTDDISLGEDDSLDFDLKNEIAELNDMIHKKR